MRFFALTIGIAVVLAGMVGCSKAPVPAPAVSQQTPSERIAEIDKLLAAPLTGSPGDADRRAVLRAERDALGGRSHTRPDPVSVQRQQSNLEAQAARDHQRTVDQLKFEAERSKVAEQRQLQAQRDQWEKEDRTALRRQNGNYRPEAPPQNVYDVQIQHTRTTTPNGQP